MFYGNNNQKKEQCLKSLPFLSQMCISVVGSQGLAVRAGPGLGQLENGTLHVTEVDQWLPPFLASRIQEDCCAGSGWDPLPPPSDSGFRNHWGLILENLKEAAVFRCPCLLLLTPLLLCCCGGTQPASCEGAWAESRSPSGPG